MDPERRIFRIVPPDPLPEGVEGPKRFVREKAIWNGLRGEIQKCNRDSDILAVLHGPGGAMEAFQGLLK